jgi:hypothetical protein
VQNAVCRLDQLRVSNFVVAAFDSDALAFCRRHILPCFTAWPVSKAGGGAAFEYNSKAFRALTKLKSVQVRGRGPERQEVDWQLLAYQQRQTRA